MTLTIKLKDTLNVSFNIKHIWCKLKNFQYDIFLCQMEIFLLNIKNCLKF